VRPTAKFCDECGAAIARIAEPAEYKQVTVLFADVVRSMDIAAALGAERLREVMGELFNRASAIVQRYGGIVDRFTGDGVMAVFGAPIALEDHALRACRAALEIQKDIKSLGGDVEHRDHVTLQLRVGLNSGEVITGEIGSGSLAYTAVGEQVGVAQRMESVAPPGGVMVSESTARLVESGAVLSGRELVQIKGAHDPVPARRLLEMTTDRRTDRVESTFVGRQWEMGALSGILDRALNGNGCVVGVVGPPGIGKSRIVREIASLATNGGVEVFTTYCESHTTDVPFHAAAGLIRATTGSIGLDGPAARTRVRARFSKADDEDLLLLEDLLGIGDPDAALPQIDPDARRRRLAAMINAATLARTTPTVYTIEDAHWIDGISESMLAEFLTVVPRTRSLVLVTYRPEYVGALAHAPRSQTIALEPLESSEVSALSTELLGRDNSVTGLADLIAERAAGNPFFAEEIVRDLTERDVLIGGRGRYLCADPVADISVPSTLQAVITARIDRLDPAAKRTLNAAAVIGSRFTPETLTALEVDPVVDDLVRAELIDQTAFGAATEYIFRHPLIRTVAYESQLKSDRAQVHRRLAAAIDHDDPNAALIAEHLEASGDLHGAYRWHMRAGTWSANSDIAAAHLRWERARQVADALSPDDPERVAMRIGSRTALCSTAFRRFHSDMSARFDELRELCTEAGDKSSLAAAMAGLTVEHLIRARLLEASRLASEFMTLVESIGDATLTIALSFAAIVAKMQTGEWDEALRWSQASIDLAEGDPTRGGHILGSPLAVALALRGVAEWATGRAGWREDFDRAMAMASEFDPNAKAAVIAYKYCLAIPRGVVLVDDAVLREIEAALVVAERSSDDMGVVLLQMTFGIAQIHHLDRQRGFNILRDLRATCVSEQFALNVVPVFDVYLAREAAEHGETELAVQHLRTIYAEMLSSGNYGSTDLAVAALVEILLARGASGDIEESDTVVGELAATVGAEGAWISRDLTVMRLRALLAQARRDEPTYRDLRDRYRAMANDLGFEGHMVWAAAMA
jgi:class 3 adenylate cyclase